MISAIKKWFMVILLIMLIDPYSTLDLDDMGKKYLDCKQDIVKIVAPLEVRTNYDYFDSDEGVRVSHSITVDDGSYSDNVYITVDFEYSNTVTETVSVDFFGPNDAWTAENIKMFAALVARFSYKDIDIEEWEDIITKLPDNGLYEIDSDAKFYNNSTGLSGYFNRTYREKTSKPALPEEESDTREFIIRMIKDMQ